MDNYAIRGIALDNSIRVLGINSTKMVSDTNKQLGTTPCAIAALGRAMSIVSLMGIMQKNKDQLSIMIDGDGPLGKIHVQYLADGKIRGYVDNPNVEILVNDNNKLDVKGVVGTSGSLNVTVKQGLKNDYHGNVPLVSGEISEDFTYYFAASEQTPSVVSAGVLVGPNNEIQSSGALIIQLMPHASEENIQYIEACLAKISNISAHLLNNPKIEDLILELFPDFQKLETEQVNYSCTCNHEDMKAKVSTLPVSDLREIKNEDKGIEAVCPWCNSKFWFDETMIDEIISKKQKNC